MRQHQKKQKIKRSNISTDGIDIAQWVVKTADKIALTFSAWDFAGQEIYYATHSFFISSKAIYLIIWDLRYPTEEARVSFWLNSVESKAANAPVILVGTHYDDPMFQQDPNKITKILTEVSEKYCPRYGNIKNVMAVSATEYAGIDQLMNIIEQTALSMPNILDKLPKIYQNLENLIIQEKDKLSPPAVTWNEYTRNIASKVNFKDEEHLLEATEFLNNLGSLVYFEKTKNMTEPLVVLDPQWLTSMFASIITTCHNYTQNGILKKNNLPQIWREPQYPQKMHKTLIKLLENFEIIFELPQNTNTDQTPTSSGGTNVHLSSSNDIIYLIPSLLPLEKPSVDILWPDFDSSLTQNSEFNRCYQIEFVPNGLFSRLMVRFLHFIDKPLIYWRNGIIGQKGRNTKAIIELNDCKISFSTRGENSSELLRIINEIVETLINDWFKVRILSIKIKCPHCIQLNKKNQMNIYQFDLMDCEHIAALGNIRTIDCLSDKSNPYPIRLDRIVPDIAMADFDGSLIDYKDITIEKTLGKGSFGVIYLGQWKKQVVAVKQLKVESDMAIEAYAEFRKEVWLMSGLDHPCIVNLIGYSTSPLVMVMECVTGGDLYGLIHNEKINIDWHVRLKIALDIAYGMDFLHSINPPLLHRDLKSPNVLVMKFTDGANVIAKVADFGLSSRLFINSLQNRAVENPTWCAPEVMVRQAYSEKADVYPFGIMMWELLTREHPYDNYRFQYQVEDDVLRGVRPTIPSDCWPEYSELMSQSWDPDPDKRPTFKYILSKLLEIIKTEIGFNKFRYSINPCLDSSTNNHQTTSTSTSSTTNNVSITKGSSSNLNLNLSNSSNSDSSLASNQILSPSSRGRQNTLLGNSGTNANLLITGNNIDDFDYHSISIDGNLMKEINTSLKLTCFTSTTSSQNQIWCGTNDGFIIVFSAISGLFMTNYISPHGFVGCLFFLDNKVWSGGKDSLGIWEIEDRTFKEENYSNEIKSSMIYIHSYTTNNISKLKFKKGNSRFVSLSRNGYLYIYNSKNDINQSPPLDSFQTKNSKIEIKSKAKGRFFWILSDDPSSSSPTYTVISFQCSSEMELNSWITELNASASMFSSYPSTLSVSFCFVFFL